MLIPLEQVPIKRFTACTFFQGENAVYNHGAKMDQHLLQRIATLRNMRQSPPLWREVVGQQMEADGLRPANNVLFGRQHAQRRFVFEVLGIPRDNIIYIGGPFGKVQDK